MLILLEEEVFIEAREDSDVVVTTTWRIRSDGDLEQEIQEEADQTLDDLDGLSVSSSFSSKSSDSHENDLDGLQCERREEFETMTRVKLSKESLTNQSNDTFNGGEKINNVTRSTQYRSGEGRPTDKSHPTDSVSSTGSDGSARSESSTGESDVVESLYELAKQVEREERYEVISRSVLLFRDALEPGTIYHLPHAKSPDYSLVEGFAPFFSCMFGFCQVLVFIFATLNELFYCKDIKYI